jgi:hypothetical protein
MAEPEYNYNYTSPSLREAAAKSDVSKVLDRHWNTLNDIASEIENSDEDYRRVSIYGGKGVESAKAVATAAKAVVDALNAITGHGGLLDKLHAADAKFVEKYGSPEEYVRSQAERLFRF